MSPIDIDVIELMQMLQVLLVSGGMVGWDGMRHNYDGLSSTEVSLPNHTTITF